MEKRDDRKPGPAPPDVETPGQPSGGLVNPAGIGGGTGIEQGSDRVLGENSDHPVPGPESKGSTEPPA